MPALSTLTRLESDAIAGPVSHSGHGRGGAEPPVRVRGATGAELVRQVETAAHAACALTTPEAAQRAGYVRSSAYTQGVGTHWTNWRYVNKPFDPARPSMLLFAPQHGTDRLVAFSYWVRSRRAPAGFAGNADQWHRHFGLCFDGSGNLQAENLIDQSDCPGDWLNGNDLWMLHTWIAPGVPNAWGLFAPLNPALCQRNVPDISRCPGTGF